ncbi:serine hydrolase domain-containing protein [Candidatus Similichlamydia laticola]|uniref:D-alanyl-D-alanine carboxypeptidase n=1 Tax=Candidatus Similichlamydia laticola TaxID=2170265 RepID=A0A369KFK2_9BACT|nr:serine hydrolase domain-containing protein [Candidatus Similichlamydia laticola]RDB31475.1 D-alanyl-D-alanine carboxypeptidase [Candidatus Similichlamydia laticola]
MADRLEGPSVFVRTSSDSSEIEGGKTDRKVAFFSRSFLTRLKEGGGWPALVKKEKTRFFENVGSHCFSSLRMVTPLVPFPLAVHKLEKHPCAPSDRFALDSFAYVMVWCGTRLLFDGSWGKDGSGNPLDSESIFRIGSLSKQVVASLFFSLAQQGKLFLDEKLVTFFPKLDFPPSFEKISLMDLLNHTSGLPTYKEDQVPKRYSSEELFKWGLSCPLHFQPGERFFYSNTGYAILGYLLEQITENAFDDLVRALFRKMGLFSTGYLSSQQEGKWVTGHKRDPSNRVTQEFGASLHQTKAFSAAGLYSSPKDLRLWYTRFLESDLARNTLEVFKNNPPKIRFDSQPVEEVRYYAGFFVQGNLLEHTGFFPGYLSQVVLHPERQAGLLILCGNENADILSMKKELLLQFKEFFGG